MISETRRFEKKDHRKWVPVEFDKLTSGCVFRIFEETGEQVIDAKGRKEFIAMSKPYINENGERTIKVAN